MLFSLSKCVLLWHFKQGTAENGEHMDVLELEVLV